MKKNIYASTLWILFCLAVWFVIYKGYSFLLAPVVNQHVNEVLGMVITSVIVPYGIALPISYLLLRLFTTTEDRQEQSFTVGNMVKATIIQSGFSMIIMFVVNIIMMVIGHTPINTFASQVSKHPIFYIFLLLIFNPIAEEFVFRKLFLSRLLKFGFWKAVIISACLFALPHVISQGVPQMFYTFILGLVWGYVTAKTGRLRYAIILHSFSNIWGMFCPLLMTKTQIGSAVYMLIWMIIMPITAIVLLVKNRKAVFSCNTEK